MDSEMPTTRNEHIVSKLRGSRSTKGIVTIVAILLAAISVIAISIASENANAADWLAPDSTTMTGVTSARDSTRFTDDYRYLMRNSDAPLPDFPDFAYLPATTQLEQADATPRNDDHTYDVVAKGDGWVWKTDSSAVQYGHEQSTGLSYGLWVYKPTATNQGAQTQQNRLEEKHKAYLVFRYPKAAYLMQAGESEGDATSEDLVDIYAFFYPLHTSGDSDASRLLFGPAQTKATNNISFWNGFWIENCLLYEMRYWVQPAGTPYGGWVAGGNPNMITGVGNMTYTERSMNHGEGFVTQNATKYYVASDLPWDWIQGRNSRLENFKATTLNIGSRVGRYRTGSNVTPIVGGNWQGFVGAVVSTVRTGFTQPAPGTRPSPFIWQNTGIEGVDTGGYANPLLVYSGGTNGPEEHGSYVDAWDQSMWMGASAILNPGDEGTLVVRGLAIPTATGRGNYNVSDAEAKTWEGYTSDFFSDLKHAKEVAITSSGEFISDLRQYLRLLDDPNIPDYDIKGVRYANTVHMSRWFVPDFGILTAATPPAPTKIVDKSTTTLDDVLTYTVTQNINHANYDAVSAYHYSDMEFTDTIPTGLTYKAGSFKVIDPNGTDVTSEGTLTTNNGTLVWTAQASYLAGNSFPMNGGDFTFSFKTDVTSIPTDKQYVNQATVKLNDSTLTTDPVTTTVDTGGITIKKLVAGAGADTNKDFSFRMTLKHSDNSTPLSGTYGDLTFDSAGIATFTLRHNGTKSITEVPTGIHYAIEETSDSNYTSSVTSGDLTGTITTSSSATSIIVTNTRKTGNLKVAKTLVGNGGDGSTAFSFKVVLKDGNVAQSGTFGGVTFDGGNGGTFTLTGGNDKTISGIPSGWTYEVSETANSNYDTTWSPSASNGTVTGTIDANATTTVTATNTRKTGKLTVKKVVSGISNSTDTFNFTVTLQDAGGNEVTKTFGNGSTATAFNNGTATFALGHNETREIPGIPTGYTYTVTETLDAAYTTTWESTPTSATPTSGTISGNVTVTATNTLKVGNLTVHKNRVGNGDDTNEAFSFVVTLKDGITPVTGSHGGHTFDSNGQCTFTLHGGESETFDNLRARLAYTVTEAANDKYTTTWEGASSTGTVADGATVTVIATNTRNVGSLTIKKVISGTSNTEDKFNFTVTLKDASGNNVNKVFDSGPTTTAFSDGTAMFQLGHNETRIIQGIPTGYTYTVTETPNTSYTTAWTSSPSSDAPASGTINGDVTVTATNTLKVGGLSVTKIRVGNGDSTNDSFSFTVTLQNGNAPQQGNYGGHMFDSNGKCTFTLQGGQTESFPNLPTGFSYVVEEAENSKYITTWEGDAISGTIANDAAISVTAKNTRKTGNLKVAKTLVGNGGDGSTAFSFKVVLKDGNVAQSGTFGGVTFDGDNGGTFTLMGGSDKTISGIPSGWTYEVSETANSDYDTTWSPSASNGTVTGTIDANATTTVTATNTRKTGSLTVRKVISGASDNMDRFTFTVTMRDAGGNNVTGTFGSGNATTTFNDGTATFSLGHNETRVISGIPTGYAYEVAETPDTAYTTTWESTPTSATPTSGIISGDVTVTATNTFKVGGLSVQKVLVNNGDGANDGFAFTVTLKEGNTPKQGNYGGHTFDAEGKCTFTLHGGDTENFPNLPAGLSYTVSETASNRYDTTWSGDSKRGVIVDGATKTVIATNTRKVGSLAIQKVIANADDTTEKFNFTVTLTDTSGNSVNRTFGEGNARTAFANGIAMFQLGHNETRTIPDIPTDYTYVVTEEPNDEYTTIWSSSPSSNMPTTGTIAGSTTVIATNTMKRGGLSISKVCVDNGDDANEGFLFTVTLKDGNTPVAGSHGNHVFDANGQCTFTLHGGDTETFPNLLSGLSYTVTEATNDLYDTTWQGSPQSGTINDQSPCTIIAKNTRKVGNLEVNKVRVANGDNTNAGFSFTVTLKDGNTPKQGTYAEHTFDAEGKCTFTLHGGETETFTGLPSGWSYAVTEVPNDLYTTAWENNHTSGTIGTNTTKTVTATNTRKVGNLKIQKIREGKGDATNDEFGFMVTLKNGDALPSGTYGGHAFVNGKYSFTLRGGEEMSLDNIPAGWSYAVSETENSRYATTWEGDAKAGDITTETTKTVTARNVRKVGKLTVTKVVAGSGAESSKDFSFTVRLQDGDVAKGGTFGGCTFDATNGYQFTLRGGNSKVIEGIPSEWTYTVSETADANYATTWAPNPPTGTMGAGGDVTITATNTRQSGKLIVKKVTVGEGSDPTKKFDFTLTLTNGGAPVPGTFGGVTFSNSGQATFSLANNETKVIEGIPINYAYQVSEAPADGYIPTWSNQSGTIVASTSGTTATCTNEIVRGDLRFVKVDDTTGEPMPGVIFKIANKATGEWHVVASDANGVVDTAAISHTSNTNANDAGVTQSSNGSSWNVSNEDVIKVTNGIWFHGNQGTTTPKNDKGALPYGVYEVEELLSTANRGYSLHAKFDVTISTTNKYDAGEIGNTPQALPTIPPEHGNTVTIYKDSNPVPNSQVQPNGTITYTLLLRNTGKDPQPRTIVRDYIPAGTEYDTSTPASNGGVYVVTSPASNKYGQGRGYVEWAVDDMLPREERTVTFSVKVLPSVGRYVFNTAYMRKTTKDVIPGAAGNPEPTEESNTVMHRATAAPTPSFVKVVKTSVPAPGTEVAWKSEIAYTLHVTNTGGQTATNVGVFDPVPEGTECTYLAEEYSATLASNKRGIGWVIPSLAVGQTVELHFTVTVTDHTLVKNAGVVRNQASWGTLVTSGSGTPTPPTSNLENTTNIIEHPLYEVPFEDAETYKWSDPAPETVVKNNDQITYQLTTTNTSSATKPYVLLRDYIPVGTVYAEGSASDNGVYVPANAQGNTTGKAYVEWLLVGIRPGDSVLRTFTVTVTEGWRTYIRNHALSQTMLEPVTPGEPSNPEPTEKTNEVKHPTIANDEDKFPFVRVIKGSSPQPNMQVGINGKITYTLDLENYSKATAYDIRVFDRVPEGTELIGAMENGRWSVAPTASKDGVGWLIKSMAPGEKMTLEFTVKVVNGDVSTRNLVGQQVIRNRASWSYENTPSDATGTPVMDDAMGNKTNIVEHPLPDPPEIQTGSQVTAYKDSDPAPNTVVDEGQDITYIINLRHTGASPQPATIVRDYIPEGVMYKESSADNGGVYVDATTSATGKAYVEWVIGEMKPGDERQVSFAVTVNARPPMFIRNMAIYEKTDPSMQAGSPSNPDPTLHTNEVWHTADPDEPTPAVVQVVKSSEPIPSTPVRVGDIIKYTLHVSNTGGSTAINWGVHDALQEGLVLVDGSVSQEHHGTAVNDQCGVAWVIESLEVGHSVDLSFSVKVSTPKIKDDLIQNQATWGRRKNADDVPEESMENTSNIVEHPLLREPKPVITKTTLTQGLVMTGGTVEFLVTVRNDGDADIVDYVLMDIPGEGLEYLSDDKGGLKVDKNKVRWNGLTLKPSDEFQVHVKCKVTATKAGQLVNVAALYRPNGERLVAIGDAEAIVVVAVASDLIQTGVQALWSISAMLATVSALALMGLRRMRK